MEFDATIAIGNHHLAAAGMSQRCADAKTAVHQAVERMEGAAWVHVEVHNYPPDMPGWVVLYPRDESITADTAEWQELRRKVEKVVISALTAAGRSSNSLC